MATEKIRQNIAKIKSLMDTYANYANSLAQGQGENRAIPQEMRFIKEEILKLLMNTKKEVGLQEQQLSRS